MHTNDIAATEQPLSSEIRVRPQVKPFIYIDEVNKHQTL
jgi:hypothetical protein